MTNGLPELVGRRIQGEGTAFWLAVKLHDGTILTDLVTYGVHTDFLEVRGPTDSLNWFLDTNRVERLAIVEEEHAPPDWANWIPQTQNKSSTETTPSPMAAFGYMRHRGDVAEFFTGENVPDLLENCRVFGSHMLLGKNMLCQVRGCMSNGHVVAVQGPRQTVACLYHFRALCDAAQTAANELIQQAEQENTPQ